MAPSSLSAGYDLGLGILIGLFVLFYAPMVYIFMAMFRQDKAKPAAEDFAEHDE